MRPAPLFRNPWQVMAHAKFDIDVIPASQDKVIVFPTGGVIFVKGDVGENAYLIKSGKVEIREGGRGVELMEAGELFGEMDVLDSEPRSASAAAVGPTELVRIDPQTFQMLVDDVPKFALTVMRLMVRRLRAVQVAECLAENLPIIPKSANSG